ncbi:hypothetical protein MFUR16E_12360 [Methylobacterium fujisawaense]
MREQAIQNPGLRQGAGVFLVRSKPQDAGEVAAQHEAQLAVFRDERHLIDERAEQFRSLCASVFRPEAVVELHHPLPV